MKISNAKIAQKVPLNLTSGKKRDTVYRKKQRLTCDETIDGLQDYEEKPYDINVMFVSKIYLVKIRRQNDLYFDGYCKTGCQYYHRTKQKKTRCRTPYQCDVQITNILKLSPEQTDVT